MTKSEILDKCIAFSVKINNLRKYLREKQHEKRIRRTENFQRTFEGVSAPRESAVAFTATRTLNSLL